MAGRRWTWTIAGWQRLDGPTGIYGAFARANIQSPVARLTGKPAKPLKLMTTYRSDAVCGCVALEFTF